MCRMTALALGEDGLEAKPAVCAAACVSEASGESHAGFKGGQQRSATAVAHQFPWRLLRGCRPRAASAPPTTAREPPASPPARAKHPAPGGRAGRAPTEP